MKAVNRFVLILLVIGTSLFSCRFEEDTGKKYALVYGINDYANLLPYPNGDLRYCENDANDIDSVLTSEGYQTTLRTGSDATKANMFSDLDNLSAIVKPEDIVVFHFSGHGSENGEPGREYLCPYELDKSDVVGTCIDTETLAAYLKKINTDKIVCIFDHCYSGGNIVDNANYIILAAAKHDEESFEYELFGNGLFTFFILQGIGNKNADLNNDDFISAAELFNFAKTNVEDMISYQHPQYYGKKDIDINLFDI
ncbi:MAG: caspase family protein [Desulfobacterales bacterium]|nr:caspase family protein [Desulfobacterales bacterium]